MNIMNEIFQKEQELKDLKYQKWQQDEKIKKLAEKEFKDKNGGLNIYINDDYAGCSIGDYSFYFGYEETICKKHPKKSHCLDDYDCEDRERCFTASIGDKEIARYAESDLGPYNQMEGALISGIMLSVYEGKLLQPKTKGK